MIHFSLYYMTESGCKWLVVPYEIQDDYDHQDLYDIVVKYLESNKEMANKLVKGWQRNGENETLTSDVDCQNTETLTRILRILDDLG